MTYIKFIQNTDKTLPIFSQNSNEVMIIKEPKNCNNFNVNDVICN